ncbi:solute carrier family 28 [Echinococcus multilocularis]|uniref:Solute carrier family 28 n=1 Tax=Echinococcus multilocularis TaxID=6211 RepID=A0A087VYC4_ECHMU|nr:solute carrier family 28 [Echinococcus multilocularis]
MGSPDYTPSFDRPSMTRFENSTRCFDETETRETEEIEPLNSIEKQLYDNIADILPKPTCEWTENDFPDLPNHPDNVLTGLLQAYSRFLHRFDTSGRCVEGEDASTTALSLRSILELLLKIGILVGDIIFVAYAVKVRRLEAEADITLLWMSTIFWLILLWLIFKHLKVLGKECGSCFHFFVCMADRWSHAWKASYKGVKLSWEKALGRCTSGSRNILLIRKKIMKLFLMVVLNLITVLYLIFFVLMRNPRNFVSLIGIVAMVLICMLISVHPAKIKWQPVLMGFFLQFTFAVLTLQTKFGYTVFEFIGAQTTALMDNSGVGALFVFGDLFRVECFAIKVLPLVVFFSSFISIMFHLGWVQQFIIQPSNFIRHIMGTTGPETINAITNIFLSMNEAPLLIKPYMSQMTNSELHAIMVNGFASIAGPVMVVYITFGVPANHLLIACVMSAPAALAIAKIIYPETKQAPLAKGIKSTLHSSPFTNLIEAATVGALEAIPLCAGIIVNLMAFLSIFSVFNRILTWLGHRIGMAQDLTFEGSLIFAYLLWPLAFGMGVPAEDCFKVGELVGIKTVLSEFIAFKRLGQLIEDSSVYDSFHNKSLPVTYFANGSIIITDGLSNRTLQYGFLHSRKTAVISSYALCGFANVGSVGILLGTFIKLLPHRRKDLSGMVVHGMIGGTIAAFVTACFAGLLYDPNL